MDEREELLALRRMAELEAKAGGAPKAPEAKQSSGILQTLGNAGAGLVRGAGSIGATLLTPYDYLAGNTKTIGNPERRQAMTDALGLLGADTDSTAFKVGKFGGEVAGTAGMPVSTGGGLLAMAGKGALSGGAASGLVDPTEALTGAAIGGALGPAIKGAAKASEWVSNDVVRPMADLFTKNGASNILKRYISGDKVVGGKNLPKLIAAARTAPDILPGGKPTMADAVAGLPEGSPLIALQEISAKTASSNPRFGQRLLDQADAVEGAKVARGSESGVNYGKAFDPALHKVKPDADLIAIAQNPYFKSAVPTAVKVAQAKGLNEADNLTEILHNIKMGLDKKLRPGFGEVGIDNAERGAILELKNDLTNWLVKNNPDYAVGREAHSKASKLIDDYKLRQTLAAKPLQPTSLGGGISIAEETRPHMPNLLSRPAMIANWAMRKAGGGIEPKVDKILADMMLDPAKFADEMSKLPPQTRIDIEKWLRTSNALTAGALSE